MPEKIVRRTKVAEGLAIVAVFIALATSLSVYVVNDRAIGRVQDSRKSLTLSACQDQNKRHRDSIAFLRALGAQEIKKGKATKAEVTEALKNYEFLFRALAPIRDCQKYVKDRL